MARGYETVGHERGASAMSSEDEIVESQGVMIDRGRQQATCGGRVLDLRRAEFQVLDVLIRRAGCAVTRRELMVTALGEDTLILDRTIDVHVHRLREQLGDRAELIETVRGIGYRFRCK